MSNAPAAPRHHHPALPLLCLGLLWACACEPPVDPEEVPKECLDDIVSWEEGTGHLNRRGSIKLMERHYADGRTNTTVVGAKFLDFSESDDTSSQQPIELSATCIGLHGQPVRPDKHCEYTSQSCETDADCEQIPADCRETDRLEVAGVTVNGLVVGSIDLDQQEMGSFIKAGLTELFGEDPITFEVQAASGTHAYAPADIVSNEIPPPVPVEVTEPDLSGSAALGRDDVYVRWTPGPDADDLVYIDVVAKQISVASPDTTRNISISCLALDDGCQGLWAEGIEWLTRPDAEWVLDETITMIVSRRREMTQDYSDQLADTELTVNLTSELYGEMKP